MPAGEQPCRDGCGDPAGWKAGRVLEWVLKAWKAARVLGCINSRERTGTGLLCSSAQLPQHEGWF